MALLGSTICLTESGWKRLDSFGTIVSPETHKKVITLTPTVRGTTKRRLELVTTLGHRHLLIDGRVKAATLAHKDVLACVRDDRGYDEEHWLRGFLFGIKHPGGAVKVPSKLYYFAGKVAGMVRVEEPPCREPPHEETSLSKIGSFIKGWVASSGAAASGLQRIVTKDLLHLEWLLDNAPIGGFIPTGTITLEKNLKAGNLYRVTMRNGRTAEGFKVVDIENREREDGDSFYIADRPLIIKGGVGVIFE